MTPHPPQSAPHQPDAPQPEVPEAVTACRGCGSPALRQLLDLGSQAACDHFPPADDPAPDPCWPLALTMCTACALVQLDHRSPAEEVPLAVESQSLRRHAYEASDRLLSRLALEAGTTVREFASNHGGSWLPALQAAGCVPAERARLVVDNQSIIHAEDLRGQMEHRVAAMTPDGYLAIEFHHALEQLRHGQFDTVRHGHPLYFSLASWTAACERHGLAVVDAWSEAVFGGCLVVIARPAAVAGPPSEEVARIRAQEESARLTDPVSYDPLAAHARQSAGEVVAYLRQARSDGLRVAAYGAGSKACTFLGVAGAGPDLLPVVADLSPGKQGRRVPGVGIPIVSPQRLIELAPDVVLVLTWDISPEVVAQLRAEGLTRARYVVPLPRLAEVG